MSELLGAAVTATATQSVLSMLQLLVLICQFADLRGYKYKFTLSKNQIPNPKLNSVLLENYHNFAKIIEML